MQRVGVKRIDSCSRDSPGDGTANVELQLHHEEDGNIPGYKMLPPINEEQNNDMAVHGNSEVSSTW